MGSNGGCIDKESSILLCLGIRDAPRAFKWVIPTVGHCFKMMEIILGKTSSSGKSASLLPIAAGKSLLG